MIQLLLFILVALFFVTVTVDLLYRVSDDREPMPDDNVAYPANRGHSVGSTLNNGKGAQIKKEKQVHLNFRIWVGVLVTKYGSGSVSRLSAENVKLGRPYGDAECAILRHVFRLKRKSRVEIAGACAVVNGR